MRLNKCCFARQGKYPKVIAVKPSWLSGKLLVWFCSLLLTIGLGLTTLQTSAITENLGFENGTTDWAFTGSGTYSINTSSLYYRTGVKSLKLNTNSTSDSKAYNSNYNVTVAARGTNYVTVIAWIRADATIAECTVGIYDSTSSVLTKSSTNFTPITSGFTRMETTFPATNNHIYYPYLYGRSTTGATVNIYYEDVIIYTAAYSSTDLTAPNAASAIGVTVSGTSITLSWTNGADVGSDIDGVMILRASGGQPADVSVKDQCNYSTSSTYGPTTIGIYSVVYNGPLVSTVINTPAALGTYTYLILMRDLGYNYTAMTSEARALVFNGTNLSASFPINSSLDGMYIPATCTLNVNSTSTVTIRNGASIDISGVIHHQGGFINNAGGTLNFNSGSLYRYNRNGSASFPVVTANWLTGSTCKIEGMTNTNPSGTNQTFANFTWSCTSQTGAANFPSGTLNINGDLTITDTKTGNLTLNNHTLKGNFTHSGGTVYYGTGTTITFAGTSTQTIDVAGPAESFYIDNNVTLNRNLTLNKTITLSTGTFNNSSNTLTLSGGGVIVRYTGAFSASPAFSGNHSVTYMSPVTTDWELPISSDELSDLTINTSGDVTINSTCYVNGNLYLTSGCFATSSSNYIVIKKDATSSGGSSTSYIKGPIEKEGDNAFTFDVGLTGYYKPLTISAPSNPNTRVLVEYRRLDPNTYYDVSLKDPSIDHLDRCEYWTVTRLFGPGNFLVTLPWDSTSCGTVNDANDVIVANWNGSRWTDQGQNDITGDINSGTVTTDNPQVDFEIPYTLGSRTGPNPLPVTLTSFDVKCINESTNHALSSDEKPIKAKITWSTASEKNSEYYSIERSEDGTHFSSIAKVAAAGNSTSSLFYYYVDEHPIKSAISFYRLKETDVDGTFAYSKIKSFNCGDDTNEGLSMTAFSKDGTMMVKVTSDFAVDCQLNIYSSSGELVFRKKLFSQKGVNEFQLGDIDMASGVYFVNLIGNDKYMSKKVWWE